ncbi:MAG: radical SAM protein [Myxococcota bacterium]|nr:radical SAM protein [Myxococcota bacterium]
MAINVNLELTDHCNIKCPMCSQSMRDDAHGTPKRFMSWESWKASLQGLVGMDEPVHLCPHWLGEPTIHPEFDAFVEYAFALNLNRRLFAEFKLHTNAVVFNQKRAELLVELANQEGTHPDCFRFIHFSIDAFSEEAYKKVKGADHRDRVFRNVETFLRTRDAMGAKRPYAHLAFVVQPDNASEAEHFMNHWWGILHDIGSTPALCWDWPHQDQDAIYFRPLNSGDQEASDALHADVCKRLGIHEGGPRIRAAESF